MFSLLLLSLPFFFLPFGACVCHVYLFCAFSKALLIHSLILPIYKKNSFVHCKVNFFLLKEVFVFVFLVFGFVCHLFIFGLGKLHRRRF